MGGLIAGVVGILMQPWWLMADPSGYIFKWLIGYSALLGPIGGVMIADYYFIRKQALDAEGLYQTYGPYRFHNGFSIGALLALGLAILPHVPGFLVQIDVLTAGQVPDFFRALYNYSWFSGFAIAFLLHVMFRRLSKNRG
jgi:NCS1 family nucleobase:cation symporter-1